MPAQRRNFIIKRNSSSGLWFENLSLICLLGFAFTMNGHNTINLRALLSFTNRLLSGVFCHYTFEFDLSIWL